MFTHILASTSSGRALSFLLRAVFYCFFSSRTAEAAEIQERCHFRIPFENYFNSIKLIFHIFCTKEELFSLNYRRIISTLRFQLSGSKTKQDWVLLVLEGPNTAHPRSLSSLALMVMDHLDGKYPTSLTLRRLVVNSATLIKYLRHQNRRAKANQPSDDQNFRASPGNYLFT